MAKRQYKVNKDYKSIAVRFNIKDKDEKDLFVFLNSMSSEDRTTFILGMYQQRAKMNDSQNQGKEMSIYERRLFRSLDKAIDGLMQSSPKMSIPGFKTPVPVPEQRTGNGLKSKSVNYDNIDFGTEKEENKDYEKLLDDMTEEGMR
jgi:hypothetical protein